MLVEHRGATPIWAGLAVAGTALGWSTGSWFQGRPDLKVRRSTLVWSGALVTSTGVLVASLAALVTDAVTVPGWLAGVGMVVGGLGMGLSMASNSVLLFDYSAPEDRGANSAALQMSDALGGLLVIGAGGVVYALFHDTWSATTLFSTVFALALAVMLLAVFVGTRVRSPSHPGL
jgi:MFS family permease